MNPESCAGQVLYPQTTHDNALVVGLANKVVFLDTNKNLFSEAERKLQTSGFISPIFQAANTDLCLLLVKTAMKTHKTGTGRSNTFHAG